MLRRTRVLLPGVALALLASSACARAAAIDVARAPASQLERANVVHSLGTRFVRYRQVVGGVPVLGAQAVTTQGPGSADLVLDGTRARIDRPEPARLRRGTAVAIARHASGAGALRARSTAALAILPDSSGGRLVWRVVLPSARPLATYEVLVDARTGTVVRVRDTLHRLEEGSAAIYDPNPVEEQLSRTGLEDASDADSEVLTALRVPVTLPRMTGDCLDGLWVHAVIYPNTDVCDPSRNWNDVTRSDSRFEALMSYFHIDRAQGYIQSLGFANVVDRNIRVNADDTDPSLGDNSYYDSSDGQINLGVGGVDDGEDADIIMHEYGHAIQDSEVPGFADGGGQAGAMGEGFADYFAAAQSANHDPSSTFDACIGEWDTLGAGDLRPVPCLRRVDQSITVDQVGPGTGCDAEVHCYGLPWSGLLWDVRGKIGATTADRLVIQSQFSLTPDATFHDAVRALLTADAALYGGAHQDVITQAAALRGLIGAPAILSVGGGSVPDPGSGSVAVNDVDRDAIPADRDNCPTVYNPDQRDWDADGRGDACDRSARIVLTHVPRRRGKGTILAWVRPLSVFPAEVRFTVDWHGRHRGYQRYASLPGKRLKGGIIAVSLRIPLRGTYRYRARIVDDRVSARRSQTVVVAVKR